MTTGLVIVNTALDMRTKPSPRYPDHHHDTRNQYGYGGVGPHTFDCSGFLQYVHAMHEIRIGTLGIGARTAAQERWLQEHGTAISLQEGIATPGALLYRAGHADMACGNVHTDAVGARSPEFDVMAAEAKHTNARRAYLVPGVDYDLRSHVPVFLGSNGMAVGYVQAVLRRIGYTSGGKQIVVDNDYGPRTENAVREYQADHGLVVDGIAGPVTQTDMKILYRTSP